MTQHRRSRGLRAGILAIPTAGALALAGCSGSAPAGSNADGTQEFSLTFSTSNTIESPFQTLAERYMETHPDVKITFNPLPNDSYDQTIRTQLQAGNAPDVLVTSPGSGHGRGILPLSEAGFLEPLSESAKALVPVGSEALFGTDGNVYGQATEITVVGAVTNDTASQTAGVSDFPADWQSLEEECASVAGEGKSLFALAGAAPPNAGMLGLTTAATRVYAQDPQWNEKRANGETTFADSDGWKAALQSILDMNEAGCFQPGAAGAGFDAITNGMVSGTSLAAFVPAPTSAQLKSQAQGSKFSVRAFPPAESSDKSFIYASANYAFSINAASENKEAATEFLEWAAQPEQTKEFAEIDGALPVSGIEEYDFSNSPYQPVAELIQNGQYGPLPNAAWPNSSVYDALATGVQGLLTEQKSVDDVLAAMDTAWGQ